MYLFVQVPKKPHLWRVLTVIALNLQKLPGTHGQTEQVLVWGEIAGDRCAGLREKGGGDDRYPSATRAG